MYKLFSLRCSGLFAAGLVMVVSSGCAPVSPPPGNISQTSTVRTAPATSLPELVYNEMQGAHLEPPASDQILGARIVEALAGRLDPDRLYLLESDLQAAASTASDWPSRYRSNDLEPARDMVRQLHARVNARSAFAIEMLATGDIRQTVPAEVVSTDRAWAVGQKELESRWKALLAKQVAGSAELGMDSQTVSDVWQSVYGRMPREKLEAHPVDSCIDCIHALVTAYDRTSIYYPHNDLEYSLGLALAGVGLSLQAHGDRTEIVKIVPGGPAARGNELRPGDLLLAVGESATELKDVLGWPLHKTVELIRGEVGSTVFLKIMRPQEKKPSTVSLIALRREQVLLETEAVSGSLIDIIREGRSRRVGVVRVPSFYVDMRARLRGDASAVSSVRDLGRVLAELKGQGAEAIVLDMRGNGGGILKEAVDSIAWFMTPKAVALVQTRYDQSQTLTPDPQGLVYEEPLVILLDRMSGSGTELFAAALRDRGRAVLVGERSAGGGTLRQYVQLADRSHIGVNQPGDISITVARFYRVNGEGIQISGLEPDLLLPSDGPKMRKPDPLALPEKSIDVPGTPVRGWESSALTKLKDLHAARLAKALRVNDDTDGFWLQQAAEVALDVSMVGKHESR